MKADISQSLEEAQIHLEEVKSMHDFFRWYTFVDSLEQRLELVAQETLKVVFRAINAYMVFIESVIAQGGVGAEEETTVSSLPARVFCR